MANRTSGYRMKVHSLKLQSPKLTIELFTQSTPTQSYGDIPDIQQHVIIVHAGEAAAMETSWEGLRLCMKDYPDDLSGLIKIEGLEKFMLFLISCTPLRRPITNHELWSDLDSQLNVSRKELIPKLKSYGLRWFSTDFQDITKHEWLFASGEHRFTHLPLSEARYHL